MEEAVTIANDALGHIDAGWADASNIRGNFFGVLIDRMLDLMDKKHFAEAAKVVGNHVDACRAMSVCAKDLDVVMQNWSVDYRSRSIAQQRVGDWQAARQVLQECVAQLPDGVDCKNDLSDLESRHRF